MAALPFIEERLRAALKVENYANGAEFNRDAAAGTAKAILESVEVFSVPSLKYYGPHLKRDLDVCDNLRKEISSYVEAGLIDGDIDEQIRKVGIKLFLATRVIKSNMEFALKALENDDAAIEEMKPTLLNEVIGKAALISAAEDADFTPHRDFAAKLAEGLRAEKLRILENHGYWPGGNEPDSKQRRVSE